MISETIHRLPESEIQKKITTLETDPRYSHGKPESKFLFIAVWKISQLVIIIKWKAKLQHQS